MLFIVVALDVSHPLRGALKLAQAVLQPELVAHEAAQKTYDRSVTADTSQLPMAPHVAVAAVESAHHWSRAASSAARQGVLPQL